MCLEAVPPLQVTNTRSSTTEATARPSAATTTHGPARLPAMAALLTVKPYTLSRTAATTARATALRQASGIAPPNGTDWLKGKGNKSMSAGG